MFKSNDKVSKAYVSPFPKTFGEHRLTIPKIFYSYKAIEKQNGKNHVPIDKSFEKITLNCAQDNELNEQHTVGTQDIQSQDQSQDTVPNTDSRPLKRKPKRQYPSRKIRSSRQKRKDRSQPQTRDSLGYVRRPEAFEQLIQGFLE